MQLNRAMRAPVTGDAYLSRHALLGTTPGCHNSRAHARMTFEFPSNASLRKSKFEKMATSNAPLLLLTLLFVPVFKCSDQNNINATVGATVPLTCRAEKGKPVSILEWSRTDLRNEFVLLYKDEQIDQDSQHPSYENRVDLQDRQMKDGNMSLFLKNVTTNDNGTYECRVRYEGSSKKLISSIHLNVRLQGDEDTGKKDGGNKDTPVGLIVGLLILVLLVAAGVLFLIYRNKPVCLKKKNPDHPAAV